MNKKYSVDVDSNIGKALEQEIKKIEQKAKQELWDDILMNFKDAFSRSHPAKTFQKIAKKHNLEVRRRELSKNQRKKQENGGK